MTNHKRRALRLITLVALLCLPAAACADLFDNLFKPSSEGGGSESGGTTTTTGVRVTAVTAGVDSGLFAGTCPKRFTFTGTITASEPGTISYKWERSDGTATPLETLIFTGSGSLTVVNAWDVASTGNGWARVKTMSPNEVTSNQAGFTLTCQ